MAPDSAGTPTAASPASPLLDFDVELSAGERWSLQPPSGHRGTWLFGYRGEAAVQGEAISRQDLNAAQHGCGAVTSSMG